MASAEPPILDAPPVFSRQASPPPSPIPPPITAAPPVEHPPNAASGPEPAGIRVQTSESATFEPLPQREFVIPTIDGGQMVIREPAKVAVSGSKRRLLRELSPKEKSARRLWKNLVVAGLCGLLMLVLIWWLLNEP
jgi:hypothetical protein